ncbi:MAG: ribosome silencing factor [Paludibacter sp.]|nr:ribosome silencing factor [Bacteroidales bacterium]MCM1068751.1 ribosome silencing factor [Prevotella sp.]MCM1354463.1 ribosome silencing factor [Bacteroides sp.]MCM1443266.1 ribosome silencing factor [Muribaculum sp.]MCM1481049.1 ribosome silencing factor [Paludibacter sp.]
MKQTESIATGALTSAIVEGIRNKKGHRIVVVDMSELESAPCRCFVIAEGTSNTQVAAIADEVEDYVRKSVGDKPIAIVGQDNAEWVAIDYVDIIVHIFQPQTREFYDIEHLWGDAKITMLPNE